MDNTFTVVIPAKGSCEYLTMALESIIPSTVKPFLIVLVDDGINPEVMLEVSALQLILPIFVVTNEGKGIVDALNTGLKWCKSEFVARLDADDLVSTDRFKLQLNFLLNNPSVVAVGGQVTYIDSIGEIKGHSQYQVGRLDSRTEFKRESMLAHPAVMMRTELAKKIGGYRSLCTNGQVDLAEDFDLWLRLSNQGQIHNLDASVLFYRQHASQLSTQHTASQIFATRYVSLVHEAESLDSNFRFRRLHIKPSDLSFIVQTFKSLPSFIPFQSRFLLALEGLIFFFNLKSNFYSRVIRKLLRILQGI